MNPFDPAELSAYLDGELPAERAHEIERLLESDPAARAEFASLAKAHAGWQASARTAAFQPAVNLRAIGAPRERRLTTSAGIVAFIILLVVAQVILRVFDALALVLVLECIALAVVLAGVGVLALRWDQR